MLSYSSLGRRFMSTHPSRQAKQGSCRSGRVLPRLSVGLGAGLPRGRCRNCALRALSALAPSSLRWEGREGVVRLVVHSSWLTGETSSASQSAREAVRTK